MLQLTNVALKISDRFYLKSVDFSVNEGEIVAIIGESGCGKTSLLKLIYGLFDLDAGTIFWKDQQITGPKENLIPGMPFIKYLSQDFDLMPFTSVAENIQKYLSRLQPELSAARTAELLEVVEMTAFAKAHVKTLSGGQKQRVALAQVLAKEPELLVLDEPFSHIDNFRKNKLRRSLFAYLKSKNISCIVATHDSTDVLSFTDKTIVMRDGSIIANAPTNEIYNHPPSYYVASLFGDVNQLPKSWFDSEAHSSEQLLLYPHQLSIAAQGIEVKVTDTFFMGSHFIVQATHKDRPLLFVHSKAIPNEEIVLIDRNF
jgi:ABC-type sulfate/molybdate transport systems ATPase subunit